MADMSVSLCGVRLKNPLVAMSGTFGFGREYEKYFDISRLGAISVKGLTLRPREGNPPPRIAETPSGCLNSVGLQNPGVEGFLRDELPWLRKRDIAVIANISANTVEEYGEMARLLGDAADIIEVNISCPNIKAGGLAFGTDPRAAAAVTGSVKKYARAPVFVKLSPNVADIAGIASAVAGEGADGIALINTLVGMRIDTETGRPVLRMNTGGLSGPAVLPVALRCVFQVSREVKLPIIGMGGVSSPSDAVEMMMAGASAVGVGTAMFADPYAPMKILHGLEAWCDARGEKEVRSLTGSVRPWEV